MWGFVGHASLVSHYAYTKNCLPFFSKYEMIGFFFNVKGEFRVPEMSGKNEMWWLGLP